jgi:predicted transcriptional regulator
MTQEELARRANFDVTGLRRIETGKVDPLWSTVLRLSAALGREPGEVVALADRIRAEAG